MEQYSRVQWMAKKEHLIMTTQKNPSSNGEIQIDRARLDSITVYEVTEDELEIIERGTPTSNYLNFSIALLSIFVAFFITLLTVEIENDRTFLFFLATTIITLIVGVILLIMWIRSNRSSVSIFSKIRARKSSDKIREAIQDATGDTSAEATESQPSDSTS